MKSSFVAVFHLVVIFLFVGVRPAQAAWIAGPDFAANELSVNELTNPNATVPAWSYGYRSTISGTSLTLFSGASQHTNAYTGNPSLQGWASLSSGAPPAVLVNTSGSTPAVLNFGPGDLFPLNPLEIYVNPGPPDDPTAIVRWTAPSPGNYVISSSWSHLDPFGGGNGVTADVVFDGASIFHQMFQSVPGNEGSTSYSGTLALSTGDTIDFVLGTVGGNNNFDSSGFNATIQAVPEPSSMVLACFAAAGLAVRTVRRRRIRKSIAVLFLASVATFAVATPVLAGVLVQPDLPPLSE